MSLNWNSFCCGKMLGMDVMGEDHSIHEERDRERERVTMNERWIIKELEVKTVICCVLPRFMHPHC